MQLMILDPGQPRGFLSSANHDLRSIDEKLSYMCKEFVSHLPYFLSCPPQDEAVHRLELGAGTAVGARGGGTETPHAGRGPVPDANPRQVPVP